MSIIGLNESIRNHRPLTERVVWFTLESHANGDRWWAMTYQEIADELYIDVASVRRAVRRLAADKIIDVEHHRRRKTIFRMNRTYQKPEPKSAWESRMPWQDKAEAATDEDPITQDLSLHDAMPTAPITPELSAHGTTSTEELSAHGTTSTGPITPELNSHGTAFTEDLNSHGTAITGKLNSHGASLIRTVRKNPTESKNPTTATIAGARAREDDCNFIPVPHDMPVEDRLALVKGRGDWMWNAKRHGWMAPPPPAPPPRSWRERDIAHAYIDTRPSINEDINGFDVAQTFDAACVAAGISPDSAAYGSADVVRAWLQAGIMPQTIRETIERTKGRPNKPTLTYFDGPVRQSRPSVQGRAAPRGGSRYQDAYDEALA